MPLKCYLRKKIETKQTRIKIILKNKENTATTITNSHFIFPNSFVAISGKGMFHHECYI